MKPILFSGDMVRAILDGRKTQTRRIVKPQPASGIRVSPFVKSGLEDGHGREINSPYQVGNYLYVRETWKCVRYDSMDGNLGYEVEFKDGERKYFEFDDNERFHEFGKYAFKNGWQPSIFMPKEAARTFLVVTNVRVERLQEIKGYEAIAEGVDVADVPDHTPLHRFNEAKRRFVRLWDSIYAKRGYGWNKNPYLWVYEFKRVEVQA